MTHNRIVMTRIGVIGLALSSIARAQPIPTIQSPSPNVPPEWQTKVERTDFRETPRYDETVAFCKRLAEASPWIQYESFGTSPELRDIPLVIAAKDDAFSPQRAREEKKLVVLVQNCIHAGECCGKDASLMLLRDIAITKSRENLLDHLVLLINPIFSVDGHERFGPYSRINQDGPDEMGWRVTAQNFNLNRDYTKADTPEMRALLALWHKWQPDLHFDNHTTDGGDWQYDITYAAETGPNANPAIAKWLAESLFPTINAGLEADGHVPMIYFGLVDSKDPSKGIRSGAFSPRLSNGYIALHDRPSILVEAHALKPYRTRVIGTYNLMRHTFALMNRKPDVLRDAIAEAQAATRRAFSEYDPHHAFPIGFARTDTPQPFTFKGFAQRHEYSEISGDTRIIYDNTKPVEIESQWFKGSTVSKTVTPPAAYIIPPQWTAAIDRVRFHGLRAERLTEPATLEVEVYRFTDVTFPDRPYEGHFRPNYTTQKSTESRTFAAGSVVVPLDQPAAKVAVHLFEPNARDSLVAWGFFNNIFERKEYAEHYTLEDLARRMLADAPELRKDFEQKLETDERFAAEPWARLYFFYMRSPYYDQRYNVYPVARALAPVTADRESLPH